MTAEEFTVQIMDMKKTLYHVSCGILRSEADREDAVPGVHMQGVGKAQFAQERGRVPAHG